MNTPTPLSLCLAALLWCAGGLFGNACGATCADPPAPIAIAFISGILTSPTDHIDNIIRLKDEYGQQYLDKAGMAHALRYPRALSNPSAGAIADLLEAIRQVIDQEPAWSLKGEILFASVLASSLIPDYAFDLFMLHRLRDYMAVYESRRLLIAPAPVAAAMSRALLGVIDDGFKILLVAHSQGNLFANTIAGAAEQHLNDLQVSEGLRVVHIAPPAPIAAGRRWITNRDDTVINLARAAGAGAPEWNTALEAGLALRDEIGDPLGHAFATLYMLKPYQPYRDVRAALDAAMAALASSELICVAVDPRGTWIAEPGLGPGIPMPGPATQLDLVSHGLAAGDTVEVRATGAWLYAGYFGQSGSATGAAAVFFADDGRFLHRAPLGPTDPGSAPEVAADATPAPCIDISEDFAIPDQLWRRVKVPAGAKQLLFGVTDCPHGDNTGIVTVEVRKLAP